jgi:hypothetical protein
MAAPVYGEDLTDLTLAEDTTGFSALGGGAAGLGQDPDMSMQGSNCVTKQISGANKGMVWDNGSTITMGADDHVFVWIFCGTPGLTDSLANSGTVVAIGTTTSAYNTFHVEGNDTYGAAGRVGVCYPIRYVNTANTTSPYYRTLFGSPGANPQWFGGKLSTTASVKAVNLGVDAMRYGTGMYITGGDISNAEAGTFDGAATQNDAVANRWGILTNLGGVFELQGKFVVGQSNSGTATAAEFEDSNKTILIVDTPHTLTDFTEIIADHQDTLFNLTNITFIASGTHNPGQLAYLHANTGSTLDTCIFDGFGNTALQGNVTAQDCTWRSAGQITQNDAAIYGCVITGATVANAVAALISDDPATVANNIFTAGADGHAIEIPSGANGTYTFVGNKFNGYGANSTGNSAIYNNSGNTVTLNISQGDTPTIRNGTGANTVINNNVAVTLTGLVVNTEVRVFEAGTETVVDGIEDVTANNAFTFSFGSGANVDIRIIHIDYEYKTILDYEIPADPTSVPVEQDFDRNYVNP